MKNNGGLIWAGALSGLLAAFAVWLVVDSKMATKPTLSSPTTPILIPMNQPARDAAVLDMQQRGFLGAYWDQTTLVVPANDGSERLDAVGIYACKNLRTAGYRGPADVQFVDRVAILNKTLKQVARVRCQ